MNEDEINVLKEASLLELIGLGLAYLLAGIVYVALAIGLGLIFILVFVFMFGVVVPFRILPLNIF